MKNLCRSAGQRTSHSPCYSKHYDCRPFASFHLLFGLFRWIGTSKGLILSMHRALRSNLAHHLAIWPMGLLMEILNEILLVKSRVRSYLSRLRLALGYSHWWMCPVWMGCGLGVVFCFEILWCLGWNHLWIRIDSSLVFIPTQYLKSYVGKALIRRRPSHKP